MLYESFKYCLEARRRQHMRQHEKNQENESPNSSEWYVFVKILKFFRKLQDDLDECFMMYFDVLDLWEPSWNDPGWILETSIFHDFSQNFDLKFSMKDGAFTQPEWIDLGIGNAIPN